MKIVSIIIKNFKVVSRNWSYFVVLVLCPVLLVLAAGAMLNSSDIANLKVGTTGDLSLSNSLGIENGIVYGSLSDCLIGLTEKDIGICVNSYNDENELNQAYEELNSLENDLIDYQFRLRKARVDFDNMYLTLKSLQTDINELDVDAAALKGDIAEFKRNKAELEERLNIIRPELDYATLQQLDSALAELDRVEADLDKIDKMLSIYQSLESNGFAYKFSYFLIRTYTFLPKC